ncbi:hypothetical protein FKM82_025052 [Ascaphus truei]
MMTKEVGTLLQILGRHQCASLVKQVFFVAGDVKTGHDFKGQWIFASGEEHDKRTLSPEMLRLHYITYDKENIIYQTCKLMINIRKWAHGARGEG